MELLGDENFFENCLLAKAEKTIFNNYTGFEGVANDESRIKQRIELLQRD